MNELTPDRLAAILQDAGPNFERYARGAEAIQESCACIRWDASDCFAIRNRPEHGEDLADFAAWDIPEECQCSCHDELRQLEEDVYGLRDED